jgi:hypothetical protein
MFMMQRPIVLCQSNGMMTNFLVSSATNQTLRPRLPGGVFYPARSKLDGPTMFARIGVMRALNRGHVREFNPSQKQHHLGAEKA